MILDIAYRQYRRFARTRPTPLTAEVIGKLLAVRIYSNSVGIEKCSRFIQSIIMFGSYSRFLSDIVETYHIGTLFHTNVLPPEAVNFFTTSFTLL